jgi:hypothetical protein
LPHIRSSIAFLCAVALSAGLGGCKDSAGVFQDKNEGGWFSKPLNVFAKPDWATPAAKSADLDTGGAVGPDDLVGADGRCSAAAAQAQAPQAEAAAPAAAPPAPANSAGTMAGELRDKPAPVSAKPAAVPAADQGAAAPPVLGGIALGMTECQAVQRAGQPGNVAISAGEKGERRVVLTYVEGPWPGIYHFNDGRLKEIERAPQPPAPPPKKTVKKKKAPAKTSQRATESVQ